MDESRLRVGTRVQMLRDVVSCREGDRGKLVGGTCYHSQKDTLRDDAGDLWFLGDDDTNAVCIVFKKENPSDFFKVLRY